MITSTRIRMATVSAIVVTFTAVLTLTAIADPGQWRHLAFTPDGKAVIAGNLTGTVRLWDTATGQERA